MANKSDTGRVNCNDDARIKIRVGLRAFSTRANFNFGNWERVCTENYLDGLYKMRELNSMIQLNTNSFGQTSRAIAPAFAFGRSDKFDKWYVHGTNCFVSGRAETASGKFVIFFGAQLVDGNNYSWPSPLFTDPDACTDFLNSIIHFQVSGYPGNWQGEGFNFIMRHQLSERIFTSDVSAWLLSH